VLCCVVLCCVVLCCVVLCCVVLCWVVLGCVVLPCLVIVVSCVMLSCLASPCFVLCWVVSSNRVLSYRALSHCVSLSYFIDGSVHLVITNVLNLRARLRLVVIYLDIEVCILRHTCDL
jgi:hypothetical protein